ncbi:MAG: lipoprotein-releasing ABC transporter permease subunit [Nitrospinota bacterium]
MAYEWRIGLRYLRAGRQSRFVSLVTWISVGGVAVGVMALIVVIGVMSGFERELRNKILGAQSHVIVLQYGGRGMADHRQVIGRVERVKGVVSASPFIYNQVMLTSRDGVSGTVVRGVDPALEGRVTEIEKNMRAGSLRALADYRPPPRSGGDAEGAPPRAAIILGKELARSLGVGEGDDVTMVSPLGTMTPAGLIPRARRFRVVGVFESGFYQYDSGLSLITLAEAQRFFDLPGRVTGVEVRVRDIFRADRVAEAIRGELGFPYFTRSWKEMNRNLFSALRLEKVTMFVILVLIILVAAFNIVGSLVMVVMEKAKDIAILKSMGATNGGIMKVFMVEGVMVGLVGTALGTLGGLGVAWRLDAIEGFVERNFGLDILPPSVYYIDRLPVQINALDVTWIILVAFFLCTVATTYPAWRASRVDPVEVLRHG